MSSYALCIRRTRAGLPRWKEAGVRGSAPVFAFSSVRAACAAGLLLTRIQSHLLVRSRIDSPPKDSSPNEYRISSGNRPSKLLLVSE